ncbi:uncharacterized protein LOC112462707 [Temnothorax curvispinosus]|uniref:Uncharacterized protein LOC112462707 n=1 Tax=Temnothorax curvispinosus TaxID=300111 RepID=A0A6J1QR29_9HYME|nr:uncharacterized protein LOC112462707 [Temnothorax curvispinosus]
MSRKGGGSRHRGNFGSYTFENVEEFKYLGSIITSDNNEAREVQARVKAANRAYFSLIPIMKLRDVRRDTKILLYKTLIRSVATYGCETWAVTQRSASVLDAFERKVLRRIYGPTQEDGMWRIRYNHELYWLYGAPKLSTYIGLMRLRWAGHVQRLDAGRMPRRVLETRFLGGRPRGRPRNRWEDGVTADAKALLQVNNWKRGRGSGRLEVQNSGGHGPPWAVVPSKKKGDCSQWNIFQWGY